MTAAELSRALRRGAGGDLRRRRAIAALALTAAGAMGVISLYQLGIIAHVPEPALPRLDGDRINGSDEAYALLSTPDAVLGLNSYAATLALAAAGAPDRAVSTPWLPLLMAGKVAIDAAQAARLTWHQWSRYRAFCSWCLLASAATFAMLPLAVPEALHACER